MVLVYVTTAIGVPVYMHYCGGELEKVTFLVKSNSCCGEEEEDMDDGCCANEGTYARFAPDFTEKKINFGSDILVPVTDLVFNTIFYAEFSNASKNNSVKEFLFPPPKLQQHQVVECTFLRI